MTKPKKILWVDDDTSAVTVQINNFVLISVEPVNVTCLHGLRDNKASVTMLTPKLKVKELDHVLSSVSDDLSLAQNIK